MFVFNLNICKNKEQSRELKIRFFFSIGQHHSHQFFTPRDKVQLYEHKNYFFYKKAMNEIDSDRSFIKNEQELCLEQELDLQNCIEEFDRIIYQIPEEFTLNSDFCDGDSNQNLTSEFTYNIEDDGDHG